MLGLGTLANLGIMEIGQEIHANLDHLDFMAYPVNMANLEIMEGVMEQVTEEATEGVMEEAKEEIMEVAT